MALSKSTLHLQLQAGCMGKGLSLQDPLPCQASHLCMLVDSSINVEWGWRGLDQGCSQCDPKTSSSSIPGKLVRNANSQASLQTYWISNFGGGTQKSGFNKPGICQSLRSTGSDHHFSTVALQRQGAEWEVMAVGASWGHWPLILRVKAGRVFWSNQGPQGKNHL